METKSTYQTIDEYIAQFPAEVQETLQTLRKVICETAPEATEKISYQMPTFVLHGNLVHFAAYANHIGFYPTPSGVAAFQSELTGLKTSKGAIQFPIDQPLPYELIHRIVAFRMDENVKKAESKVKRKK
ncbi:MAG: DUF1801 domain-containing protein [Sporolactobacillus sp.]|uniref:iron chaperone n=1 Tax=Sporolactobacillus sp. STSJ-5 TaxID=2965076 RepID=UPI002104FF59|nr:DUF1801 domain-containing protein [Sporolactobacillus sp. STSJ-5]MCQ2010969.1 DUF1801 domain-containing protein [Sporolactobacillus sp. STSJ-5]